MIRIYVDTKTIETRSVWDWECYKNDQSQRETVKYDLQQTLNPLTDRHEIRHT